MSATDPECVRCRVLQTEVVLLRAEIDGLRATVLDLTRHSTENGVVLEILGVDQPQRFSLARSERDGPEFYRVSLTYRNDLSASCLIADVDPARFLAFFEDLAQHKQGWKGEKKVSSLEGQLAITCTYDGHLYRPEVWMCVYCALDSPAVDPYWTVELRLEVDPETLEDLAVRARRFFINAATSGGALDPGGS
jgi:hypothetical protein